jgi:DNA-binding HxlR family transcriptional regulator
MSAVAKAQECTKKWDTHQLETMAEQAAQPPCSTVELEAALKILEGRWKALIIFHLFSAPVLRFSELQRAIPGVSQKMLIQQLRDLEGHGIVTRKVYPEVPPKVEYALSEDGLALRPALIALQTWAASKRPAQSSW